MTDLDTRGGVREPQESAKRWRIVGPGLVVAATGIGAGDLVATLVAGSRFGYALLWAAVLGVIIKIFLVEGAGRYSLATGKTIFEGWRTVGRWTTWYFGPYILIWGLVYGAAAMSSSALPLAALFPGVDLKVFAIACGLVGAVVVWFGRYSAFEKIIAVFVGLIFVTVVGAAVVTVPNVPALLTGLVPTIPEGGLVVALSIAGGVGGTITLAAYGYWLREKGWVAPGWMKVMRIDNSVAYVMSGVFVLSMLVVGAELLYSADIALADGEGGLVQLADVLGERYGAFMTWFFLLGFFATSFSSILGVWNGVSLMFADFLGTVRGLDVEDPRRRLGGSYYRAFIVWLTIPPIGLLFLDQPIGLIIAYGVLGALFMPFLAITLLVLLNTDRTPRAWRNRPLSNTVMGLSALLFVVLGVQQLVTEVGKLL
ncbi:divalent metal cation transporter [Clavibacter michiganensis subsp. insidiosus]|uniref:Divalent metal cation transporter n=1 Tax=Clavibacter michiganensis subsp. insidiosus TaxID=33014 RepID=A0A399N068_9MICO|nr:Nramp family divalent metal transporter [Clavibacter michiganensis]AWG01894.1 iron transporter [Clavibacter michiganensis subsp. insidiosus]OQJ59606.1 iron transporter [Clavibacter michiganensis subsp. insidiosus]RII87452.1 divalent metal cation transporter [Clavibacter michiganensis subsp. insidiosus]RIJ44426.1 divalent metal cation transporter [Clavibacter michiganensis subsp. insidiosus]RMC88078.1 divalent metal cation transporter [Clavibacter michiganensis subsp. insidiosus]